MLFSFTNCDGWVDAGGKIAGMALEPVIEFDAAVVAGKGIRAAMDRMADAWMEHLTHIFEDDWPDAHNDDCAWCAGDVYEREVTPELLIF